MPYLTLDGMTGYVSGSYCDCDSWRGGGWGRARGGYFINC